MWRKRNFECIPVTGKKNDSFVGVKVGKEWAKVFYPETFHLSEEEGTQIQEILALLRSIGLAKSYSEDMEKMLESQNVGGTLAMDAFIWILNDFSKNKVYPNTEKRIKANAHGKINWRKTLQKRPIISNGNLIYKDIYSETKRQQDSKLTEIYKYCVRTASDAIGWLVGISFNDREKIPYNPKEFEALIKKELELTFDDEKRRRLLVMLSIVEESSSGEDYNGGYTYGVTGYDYVYERMINQMFGNVDDLKEYYPNGEWNLNLFDKPFSSSNLRPDTVMELEEAVYIIDAKNYRFGFTGNKGDLPNTASIQKQITYGEHTASYMSSKKIINVFMLPYDKLSNSLGISNNFEYVGTATARWRKKNETYEFIHTILIDMHFLVMNWNRTSYKFRKNLVLLIAAKSPKAS